MPLKLALLFDARRFSVADLGGTFSSIEASSSSSAKDVDDVTDDDYPDVQAIVTLACEHFVEAARYIREKEFSIVECYDYSHNRYYYHNTETGNVFWSIEEAIEATTALRSDDSFQEYLLSFQTAAEHMSSTIHELAKDYYDSFYYEGSNIVKLFRELAAKAAIEEILDAIIKMKK